MIQLDTARIRMDKHAQGLPVLHEKGHDGTNQRDRDVRGPLSRRERSDGAEAPMSNVYQPRRIREERRCSDGTGRSPKRTARPGGNLPCSL